MPFFYKVKKLETVKSYKYLGLSFGPFGNFTLARQELKNIALKALFKKEKKWEEILDPMSN
jgi:hypothetical protein